MPGPRQGLAGFVRTTQRQGSAVDGPQRAAQGLVLRGHSGASSASPPLGLSLGVGGGMSKKGAGPGTQKSGGRPRGVAVGNPQADRACRTAGAGPAVTCPLSGRAFLRRGFNGCSPPGISWQDPCDKPAELEPGARRGGADGGSHYQLMELVAQTLQDHGHDVTFLQPSGLSFISGFKVEKKYQALSWFPPEDCLQEYKDHIDFCLNEAFQGRELFTDLLKLMKLHAVHCNYLLRRTDIMGPLKNASFDLVVVDGTDGGAFLVAEKLGSPWVAVLPVTFGAMSFGLPEAVSYIPVFGSYLTDRMDFWGRVWNSLMFLVSAWVESSVNAQFDDVITEHFPADSRPELFRLRQKAELWFVNSDFAFEFARPLLPNTVYIGGLTNRPVEPVPPVSKTLVLRHKGNVGLSSKGIAKWLYEAIAQFLGGTKQQPRVSLTLDAVSLFMLVPLVRAQRPLQSPCSFRVLSDYVKRFSIC